MVWCLQRADRRRGCVLALHGLARTRPVQPTRLPCHPRRCPPTGTPSPARLARSRPWAPNSCEQGLRRGRSAGPLVPRRGAVHSRPAAPPAPHRRPACLCAPPGNVQHLALQCHQLCDEPDGLHPLLRFGRVARRGRCIVWVGHLCLVLQPECLGARRWAPTRRRPRPPTPHRCRRVPAGFGQRPGQGQAQPARPRRQVPPPSQAGFSLGSHSTRQAEQLLPGAAARPPLHRHPSRTPTSSPPRA